MRLAVCTIATAQAAGSHRARIAAEDLGHQQGDDRAQALGGREEAVLEGGLHGGRAAGTLQALERVLHQPAPLLQRGLEPAEGGFVHAGDGTTEGDGP